MAKQNDLAGMRFGHLTCIEPTGKSAPDRSAYWRCACDCGRETTAAANKLMYGRYTSCGCMKAKRLYESNVYVDGTCVKQVLSDTVRTDNTSGVPGVYRKRDRWGAKIQYKKKTYYLGVYQNKEDAIRARRAAEAAVKDDAAQLMTMINSASSVS